MVLVEHYLVVSALLFSIGAAGIFFHRNPLSLLLCIQVMLNAVNLTLVATSRGTGSLEGQALAFLVILVAGGQALMGLAILVAIYRGRASVDADDFQSRRLRLRLFVLFAGVVVLLGSMVVGARWGS